MGIPKIYDGFWYTNFFTVLDTKTGNFQFILQFLEFPLFKDKIQAREFQKKKK